MGRTDRPRPVGRSFCRPELRGNQRLPAFPGANSSRPSGATACIVDRRFIGAEARPPPPSLRGLPRLPVAASTWPPSPRSRVDSDSFVSVTSVTLRSGYRRDPLLSVENRISENWRSQQIKYSPPLLHKVSTVLSGLIPYSADFDAADVNDLSCCLAAAFVAHGLVFAAFDPCGGCGFPPLPAHRR